MGKPDEGSEVVSPHTERDQDAVDNPPAGFFGVDGKLKDKCGGEDNGSGHGIHTHFLPVAYEHGG